MKYIVSTTGSPIEFMLDGNHTFLFDTLSPTKVTDEQFVILQKRLGVQLKEVSQETPVSEPVEADHIDEEM